MKNVLSAIVLVALTFAFYGCEDVEFLNREILYQNSTISELAAGAYDGEMTAQQVLFHGDFGLGCFDRLDGEMILCQGLLYRVASDGYTHPITEEEMLTTTLPFAAVTFFDKDQTIAVHGLVNYDQLKNHLDNLISNHNMIYAIRVDGLFRHVKVRSVPAQNKPYAPLAQVVQDQPTYEFHNTQGTLIGFRFPAFMAGVNVPGYHFHFITKDRRQAGHVLELELEGLDVHLDATSEMHLTLQQNPGFNTKPVSAVTTTDINTIE